MLGLGATELIIIAVIVILFFGVGRISKISGEAGSAIRKFRDGLQGDGKGKDESAADTENSEPSKD
jgi:sec-independent protein translocase protein TatA